MKKISKNFKNIFLIISVLILCLTFTRNADAQWQYSYACADGGVVTAIVDMIPSNGTIPTYPANPSGTHFDVSASIPLSTCGTRDVKLTAQNNNGLTYDIIQQQSLPQMGQIPTIFDTINFAAPATPAPAGQQYTMHFVLGVDDTDPTTGGSIGSVFATGPHVHGSTYVKKVVYIGQAIHPQLTVRVKRYGTTTPYTNTTNPNPPANEDEIYVIPAGTASTTIPQIVSCTSNCGIPLSGANYSTAVSVTGANVDVVIPQQINGQTLHVCKYPDAPGDGMYFSPVFWTGSSLDLTSTCADRYPDSETIR